MTRRPNILLITADQWRGDCIGSLGHPVVKTPHLDAFGRTATVFEQHYAGTAPCSPARACLYTGLYQMNHRVVWNGAPLDDRFDNLARAARRAGYRPTLFGYTDTSPDPRLHDPADPALQTYEGVLPGFDVRQSLPEDDKPWLSWLASRGHDPSHFDSIHHVAPEKGERISLNAPRYASDETQTAFLTNAFLDWLAERETEGAPFMAHISFLRPHPPMAVPEPYNKLYDPDSGPDFAGADTPDLEAAAHPLIAALQAYQQLASHIPGADGLVRDLSRRDLARIRALYYGMITEVDAQLGRIFEALTAFPDTMVIFTSDHAEMMGDHWMLGKGGYFRQSYHIPLMIRLPGGLEGNRVTAYTSAVDIFATLLDLLDLDPQHAPDGSTLMPFLKGQPPLKWRDAALWEYDFRELIRRWPHLFPGLGPETLPGTAPDTAPALISRLTEDWHYVHFSGLPNLLSGRSDPHGFGHVPSAPPDVALQQAEALLSTRLRHNDETLARTMVWDYYSQ